MKMVSVLRVILTVTLLVTALVPASYSSAGVASASYLQQEAPNGGTPTPSEADIFDAEI